MKKNLTHDIPPCLGDDLWSNTLGHWTKQVYFHV